MDKEDGVDGDHHVHCLRDLHNQPSFLYVVFWCKIILYRFYLHTVSWSLWWGQVKVLGNVSAPPETIISFVQTFTYQSYLPIVRYHLQGWKWPHGTLPRSSQEQGPEYVCKWMPGVTLISNEYSSNNPLSITCNQSPWAAKGLSGDTSVPATFWFIKYC